MTTTQRTRKPEAWTNAPGRYALAFGRHIVTANADGQPHVNSRCIGTVDDNPDAMDLAADMVRRANAHDDLLAASEKAIRHMNHLADMVNTYSHKLGLGRKVHAEDWGEQLRAAIAKARGT